MVEQTEKALIQQKSYILTLTGLHAYVRCYDTYVNTDSHAAPGHWKYEMSALARPYVTITYDLPVSLIVSIILSRCAPFHTR